MKPTTLILSCVHAVKTVPDEYAFLFAEHQSILDSHHAVDIGSFAITQHLSQILNCEYTYTSVSRLLIDCNNNGNYAHCFSEYSKILPKNEKQKLIAQYHKPFRQQTESLIQKYIDAGHQALHISIRSFASVVDATVRNAGIGLLYDSHRHAEKEVARLWHGLLLQQTAYRIRMNYPYAGSHEGFIGALRKRHVEKDYLGIELEINQALLQHKESFEEITCAISISLQELLQLL